MDTQELQASLLLNAVKDIGPARYQALIKKFGAAQIALASGVDAWGEIPLFDADTLVHIESAWGVASARAEADWRLVEKQKIRVYLWQQGPYPRLLKEISHAPPVLYVKGEDVAIERPAVALVGSRRCSFYGEKIARQFAAELAQAGVTTVSGLARGIDTHVHKATLDAGGKTWAVVGCGLSKVYPPENRALAQMIEEGGAIISEFPMGTMPFPANFPRRNRIIAGISLGTVVIEGGDKSGSLITARLAAEEGRDVFAVPGAVTSPLSAAPNQLIHMGAAMVRSAAEILREVGLESLIKSFSQAHLETLPAAVLEMYQPVLELLTEEPVPREILAQRLNKEPSVLSSLLLEMELKGLVRSAPGGSVIKI